VASGDHVVVVGCAMPTAAYAATEDHIEGASVPHELIEVRDFSAASKRYCDFHCHLLPGYDGGGLTFRFATSASATAGGATQYRLEAAIRRIADDAEDLDTTVHTYDYNGASISPPSAIGEVTYDEIAFASGVDMDNLAAGEDFILRIRRNTDHADDDMPGDMELHVDTVTGRET
jgi:hypothetical protein